MTATTSGAADLTAAIAATTLDAAHLLRDRGWRPFPLDHPAVEHCVGAHRAVPCDGKRGKHPAVAYGTATASAPADGMLGIWFREPRNVGVACGPSGLVVLDEDERNALAKLAADLGHDLPKTYRVSTSRGWHWYFRAPTDVVLGNRSGRLAEYHIDVRGGKGHGGYVVAAGSVHATGHVYEAEDPDADVAELPAWLIAEIQAPTGTTPGEAGEGGATAWDDDPRHGYADELRGQYRRHLDGIRTRGGDFRHELFLAARDGYRLIACGLLDLDTMGAQLAERVRAVWGANPDERDRHIVNEEAYHAAARSPWVLVDPPAGSLDTPPAQPLSPGEVARLDVEAAEVEQRARFESDVEYRVRQLDVNEEATRRRRLRERAERPSIADELLDVTQLVDIEPPRMLLGSLIPEASVGFLNGRTGTYKSFLAVSWACSLATGRPWLDRPEFAVSEPVKVLYVAAEGARGIAQRVLAWQAVHGAIPAGQLAVYPKPIRLNDEYDVAELAALVEARGYQFLVVDTLHRSAPGAEENSATDFGVVFEAVADLRDRFDLTTMFVDHTGHRGGVLGRGTTAKVDDPDFVLGIERDGEIPTPDVQRTLKVAKLKDEPVDGSWPIRLRVVEGAPAAVLEIGDVRGADDPFGMRTAEWWQHEATEPLPDAVGALRGAGADAGRDGYRVLRFVGGTQGMTISELLKSVNAVAGGRKVSEASLRRGMRLLDEAGIVVSVGARYVLDVTHADGP